MVASGDRATATVMHTDVCEQHVIDDRTVHRRVRNLVRKTVESTTDDLMRTDPRGFPSWPEAVTASLRGRIHWRGRSCIDEGSLRIAGVEIAQDAIPTPAWTAHRTRRPQRPTGRLAFTKDDGTHKMTRYLNTREAPTRIITVASLR